MKLSDIKVEDIQKMVALLATVATVGKQVYDIFSKYQADNPDLTLEQFLADVTRIENIPTPFEKVYPEDKSA